MALAGICIAITAAGGFLAAVLGGSFLRDTPAATPYLWVTRIVLVCLWVTVLGSAVWLVASASRTSVRLALGVGAAVVLAGLAAWDVIWTVMLDFFLFWQF